MAAPRSQNIELGGEALHFVRHSLEMGKTLARALKALDLEDGHVYGLCPASMTAEEARHFDEGGFSEVAPAADVWSSVDTLDAVLAEHIVQELSGRTDAVCVFEDESAERDFEYLKDEATNVLFLGAEVYRAICGPDPDLALVTRTVDASKSWLTIGAIGTGIGGLCSRRQEISSMDLSELAKAVREVYIGAYDGEGYVVWRRR